MRAFQDLLPEFETANTQVLGVSTDSWAANGAFQRELGLTFPLLSDWPQFNAMKTLGILREDQPTAQRVVFVLDKDRVLRGRVEGEQDMTAYAREALRIVKEL